MEKKFRIPHRKIDREKPIVDQLEAVAVALEIGVNL